MRKNLGCIYMSKEFHESKEGPEFFILLKLMPVRVEFLYQSNEFEIFGYSPFFKDLKEGEAAPNYQVMLMDDGNKKSLEVFEV